MAGFRIYKDHTTVPYPPDLCFKDELVEVYRDGKLLIDWSFEEIRNRASVKI